MKINRISAFLLCAAMGVPLVGELTVHAETDNESTLHVGHYDSFEAFEEACLQRTVTAPMVSESTSSATVQADLPSSYDMRKEGLVTSVKSQGSYGTCWTFASMNSLESTLIAGNPDVDLSEWHLAYYAYSETFGFPLTEEERASEDAPFDSGGNFEMLSCMLTGWIGPMSESYFPYDDWSVLENEKTMEEVRQEAEYHVTDTVKLEYVLPSEDGFEDCVNAAKLAIYEGNSLGLSYFDGDAFYNTETSAYYCPAETTDGGYHAVSVVGWDDDYPAENFTEDPGIDGAWLVKNSWGTDFGENGYFWISYAESTVYELFYLEAVPAQLHADNYQHDDYGCGVTLSVEENDTTVMMANMFTAEKDTYITDIMVFAAMANDEYEITVYSDVKRADSPTSGIAASSAYGTFSERGYHTITLDKPVKVESGERFAVTVKLSGEAGQHIPSEAAYYAKITYPDETVEEYDTYIITKDMIQRDLNAGESFYSTDGKSWFDLYEESVLEDSYTYEDDNGDEVLVEGTTIIGNICIKALTQNAGIVMFSDYNTALPIGEEITLSSVDGGDIYYSVNGGAYQLYSEPILFTEEMTVSAYVDGYSDVYEQEYAVRQAKLSSLTCSDGEWTEQLTFEETAPNRYEAVCSLSNTVPETIGLMPITTGNVLMDGTELLSGVMTEVNAAADGKTILALRVSEEGMTETVYVIHFTEPVYGTAADVDQDGQITALDAADVLVYSAKVGTGEIPELPDAEWELRADLNADGEVNATDAARILVYAAQIGSSKA